MLTWEDDVEVHALRRRGWSISAIARHTGFDRKTVRKYFNGGGEPGVRARPGPVVIAAFGYASNGMVPPGCSPSDVVANIS